MPHIVSRAQGQFANRLVQINGNPSGSIRLCHSAQFFMNGFAPKYENARSALDCGGSTPPCFAPPLWEEAGEKAASSRRSPRCLRHSHFRNSKRRNRRSSAGDRTVLWTSLVGESPPVFSIRRFHLRLTIFPLLIRPLIREEFSGVHRAEFDTEQGRRTGKRRVAVIRQVGATRSKEAVRK